MPYPFYVEVQVRPSDAESLRWAYKNLQWSGEEWSFDTADWSGAAPQDFALLRAYDLWGNATALNIPIDPGVIPTPEPGPLLYLPMIQTP